MRDHNDNLIPDTKDHVKYFICRVGVQIARRLVKHQDIVIVNHKPCDIDPLFFSKGDFPGIGGIGLFADKLAVKL